MKSETQRDAATEVREHEQKPRPKGEQAIGPELYAQIRQALRDLQLVVGR